MITRNFEITIRIPEQNYIPTLFQVVENDKDVYNLTIHITDGINEIDYSQVSSATITFALANGAVVQSDPERLAISSGGITYEMGTTEISCPGKVLASIQLFGSGGERLTTARFQFEVVADLITPGAVQSESRFPILQQLVADVEQLKQDIVNLQIPDGSIMDVKLSDAAGQIKQRVTSKNLLHNWDFRNPVNQRGQSSYSGITYTIDRWKQRASSDVTTVNVGSVTFGKSTNVGPFIIQDVENLSAFVGQQVTFSIKILAIEGTVRLRFLKTGYDNEAESGNIDSTGIFSFTHTITSETIGVAIVATTAGAKVTLESAKLELGPVSTLANDPPADFGEELRKCQRYLFSAIDMPASGVGAALGMGVALSATEIRILLPIPAHMRPIAATVILSSPSHFQCVGTSTLNISALAHGATSSNFVMLIATVTGATPGQSYYLRRATGATDGRLLISKEL